MPAPPIDATVLGLGLGSVALLAVLAGLYLWFCVYWWRGGRPITGPPPGGGGEHPTRHGHERPRRAA